MRKVADIELEDLNRIDYLSEEAEEETQIVRNCAENKPKIYIQINDESIKSLSSLNDDTVTGDSFNAMQRRWSKHVSEYARNKEQINEKIQKYFKVKKIYYKDGRFCCNPSNNNDGNTVDEVLEQINQRFKQVDEGRDAQSRRTFFRDLVQPLAVKQILKSDFAVIGNDDPLASQQTKFPKSFTKFFCVTWNFLYFHLWLKLKACIFWTKSLDVISADLGTDFHAYFLFLRTSFVCALAVLMMVLSFLTIPQMIYYQSLGKWRSFQGVKAKIKFLSSLGFYESYSSSVLKYGFLSKYNLPLAYIVTIVIVYLLVFIWMSICMASLYRRNCITALQTIRKFSQLLFCSWPFQISTPKAAAARHENIQRNFKCFLQSNSDSVSSLSLLMRIRQYSTDTFDHLVVSFVICSSAILNFFFMQRVRQWMANQDLVTIFMGFSLKLTVWLMEIGFYEISRLIDKNSKSQMFRVTLIRSFVGFIVNLCNLGFLLVGFVDEECWESKLGMNLLYLFVVNLLNHCLLDPLFFVLIGNMKRFSFDESDLFLININLNHFYTLLLWCISIVYMPLSCVVLLLIVSLEFHVNRFVLKHFNKKCRSSEIADQLKALQMILSFLILFGSLMIQTFIITHIPASRTCGPFRNHLYIFEPLMEKLLNFRRPTFMDKLLLFVLRPYVVGMLMALMSFMVYYMSAKANMHGHSVKVLQELLHANSKEKARLLREIRQVLKDRPWLLEMEKNELRNDFSELSYWKRRSSYQ